MTIIHTRCQEHNITFPHHLSHVGLASIGIVYNMESLPKQWMCCVNRRGPVIAKWFPKVPVCFIFSISALFPNYLTVHLVEYLDRRLSPGSGIAVSVFSQLVCLRLCVCVCTCRRGLAGDLAVSERICVESSSHCGSDDMPPHVHEYIVGCTWLRAISGTVIFKHVVSEWVSGNPAPPHSPLPYTSITAFKYSLHNTSKK